MVFSGHEELSFRRSILGVFIGSDKASDSHVELPRHRVLSVIKVFNLRAPLTDSSSSHSVMGGFQYD